MKKFLSTAVAGLAIAAAMASTAFAANTGAAMTKAAKPTVDIACIKTAVDKREDALMVGWSTFNASIVTAYSTRMQALDAAWILTEAKTRIAAVKATWAAFSTAKKAAQKQWSSDRAGAWKTFGAAAKACDVTGLDAAGEQMDQ